MDIPLNNEKRGHLGEMTLPPGIPKERKRLPHEVPSWVCADAVYFITLCTQSRGGNVLAHDGVAAGLMDSVVKRREAGIWWPYLFLIMPDHVHGLFSFAPEPGMRACMAAWKRYTSRKLGVTWQRDFFEHRMRQDESWLEKAAYIRQNPVRAGWVSNENEWPYMWAWDAQGRDIKREVISALRLHSGQAR